MNPLFDPMMPLVIAAARDAATVRPSRAALAIGDRVVLADGRAGTVYGRYFEHGAAVGYLVRAQGVNVHAAAGSLRSAA